MQIGERLVGDVKILDLTGKMTLGEGDELLRDKVNSLVHQGHKKLVLNLEGVGLQSDPVFGPVVMAGLGGILVEVLRDVAFARTPVTHSQALEMLDSLRGRAVLAGARGRPAANRERLAELIAAVSRFGAASGPRLAELDLNPVLAGADGAVAVDWLLVRR